MMIKRVVKGLISCSCFAGALIASQAIAAGQGSSVPVEAAPERSNQAVAVGAATISTEQAVANFVAETAARYQINPVLIEMVLGQAQRRDSIIKAMSRPAERVKPWNEYRPIFVTPAQIQGGQSFLAANREALLQVQRDSGVPAEVIVAIIGVETGYGRNMGNYRVIDALYTLAFFYPRTNDPDKQERENQREFFFRDELAQLFALARDESLDITELKGSYAGAMGMGQFMPSSYRDYAVDGNRDGRRDLFNSKADVFASVANYFVKKGGWVRDAPVAVRAELEAGAEEYNPIDWEPRHTMSDLQNRGYRPLTSVPAGVLATPVSLTGSQGQQYWLGFQNYYAITRYNISKMYAMAVYQLSEGIAGREIPPA